MSQSERTRAFAIAAAVILAAIVVLLATQPRAARPLADDGARAERRATIQNGTAPARETGESSGAGEATATPAPSSGATATPAPPSGATATPASPGAGATPGAEQDLPPAVEPLSPSSPTHTAIERHASEFAAVFFRYELGDITPAVRRDIDRLADPALASELLAQPPRTPATGVAPPPARLLGVDSIVPAEGGGYDDVVAEIERDGSSSRLSLTVERSDGRWRTTGVD